MKTTFKKQEGFTIIEVLIVLAIAGLIMLVVFLAVPSLQRNQRNSGRDADGSRIAAAANEFTSNNNGAVPSTVAQGTQIVNSAGNLSNLTAGVTLGVPAAAATACDAAEGDAAATNGRLIICTGAAVTFNDNPPADKVILATGAQCNGANAIQIAGVAGRQMAVVYTKERQGGISWACKNI